MERVRGVEVLALSTENPRRQLLSSAGVRSGRRDLNPRPLAPQASALAKLRYGPIIPCFVTEPPDRGNRVSLTGYAEPPAGPPARPGNPSLESTAHTR